MESDNECGIYVVWNQCLMIPTKPGTEFHLSEIEINITRQLLPTSDQKCLYNFIISIQYSNAYPESQAAGVFVPTVRGLCPEVHASRRLEAAGSSSQRLSRMFPTYRISPTMFAPT